jgi:hypothetical protein
MEANKALKAHMSDADKAEYDEHIRLHNAHYETGSRALHEGRSGERNFEEQGKHHKAIRELERKAQAQAEMSLGLSSATTLSQKSATPLTDQMNENHRKVAAALNGPNIKKHMHGSQSHTHDVQGPHRHKEAPNQHSDFTERSSSMPQGIKALSAHFQNLTPSMKEHFEHKDAPGIQISPISEAYAGKGKLKGMKYQVSYPSDLGLNKDGGNSTFHASLADAMKSAHDRYSKTGVQMKAWMGDKNAQAEMDKYHAGSKVVKIKTPQVDALPGVTPLGIKPTPKVTYKGLSGSERNDLYNHQSQSESRNKAQALREQIGGKAGITDKEYAEENGDFAHHFDKVPENPTKQPGLNVYQHKHSKGYVHEGTEDGGEGKLWHSVHESGSRTLHPNMLHAMKSVHAQSPHQRTEKQKEASRKNLAVARKAHIEKMHSNFHAGAGSVKDNLQRLKDLGNGATHLPTTTTIPNSEHFDQNDLGNYKYKHAEAHIFPHSSGTGYTSMMEGGKVHGEHKTLQEAMYQVHGYHLNKKSMGGK